MTFVHILYRPRPVLVHSWTDLRIWRGYVTTNTYGSYVLVLFAIPNLNSGYLRHPHEWGAKHTLKICDQDYDNFHRHQASSLALHIPERRASIWTAVIWPKLKSMIAQVWGRACAISPWSRAKADRHAGISIKLIIYKIVMVDFLIVCVCGQQWLVYLF